MHVVFELPQFGLKKLNYHILSARAKLFAFCHILSFSCGQSFLITALLKWIETRATFQFFLIKICVFIFTPRYSLVVFSKDVKKLFYHVSVFSRGWKFFSQDFVWIKSGSQSTLKQSFESEINREINQL